MSNLGVILLWAVWLAITITTVFAMIWLFLHRKELAVRRRNRQHKALQARIERELHDGDEW